MMKKKLYVGTTLRTVQYRHIGLALLSKNALLFISSKKEEEEEEETDANT